MLGKFLKNHKYKTGQKGFTLIEMVLVIMITGTVFLASYALFANTVKHDVESRYEIIAANLAQEGVEIIRNIRDENFLRSINDASLGIEINDGLDNTCYPYIRSNGKPICNNVTRNELIEKETLGTDTVYQNCDSDPCSEQETDFKRSCAIGDIVIDPTSGLTTQFAVTCTITWTSFFNPSIAREVAATSVLTNWQE